MNIHHHPFREGLVLPICLFYTPWCVDAKVTWKGILENVNLAHQCYHEKKTFTLQWYVTESVFITRLNPIHQHIWVRYICLSVYHNIAGKQQNLRFILFFCRSYSSKRTLHGIRNYLRCIRFCWVKVLWCVEEVLHLWSEFSST